MGFAASTSMTASAFEFEALPPCAVAVVGVPLDENSSFLRGPALAPRRIREMLQSGSSNWCTEDVEDLSARADWRDVGDIDPRRGAAARASVEHANAPPLARGANVLTLGG